MRPGIEENDFELISNYYRSGDTNDLSEAQTEILNRWQSAYAILRQYPSKHVATKKLMLAFPGLSRAQAYLDVENAMRFWNKHAYVDREFIENWFVDRLMTEIANCTEENARAKNLATLEKYLSKLPPERLDPKLMEKNDVYIQININGKKLQLSEKELEKFPQSIRQKLFETIPDAITEEKAIEIMDS